MITQKIKALESAQAKVQELEAAVARGLHKALAQLPDDYGFESVDAFIRAIKSAAKGSKAPRAKRRAAAKPRRRAKITNAVRKAAIRLVKAGKTGAQIAKALKISLPSVQNIKKAAGLVRTAPTAVAKKKPAAKRRPKQSPPKKPAAPVAPPAAESPAASAR
jgi:DNA-binding CsgD family transcriptional regulator